MAAHGSAGGRERLAGVVAHATDCGVDRGDIHVGVTAGRVAGTVCVVLSAGGAADELRMFGRGHGVVAAGRRADHRRRLARAVARSTAGTRRVQCYRVDAVCGRSVATVGHARARGGMVLRPDVVERQRIGVALRAVRRGARASRSWRVSVADRAVRRADPRPRRGHACVQRGHVDAGVGSVAGAVDADARLGRMRRVLRCVARRHVDGVAGGAIERERPGAVAGGAARSVRRRVGGVDRSRVGVVALGGDARAVRRRVLRADHVDGAPEVAGMA